MKHLNLLIKPSSSNCNISCKYCFYSDVAKNREYQNLGFMSYETIEKLVIDAFEMKPENITFSFQGGEPTLVGIDFYKKFHEFVKKYKNENTGINFSMQTNGILINKNWMELFKNYNYLLGVSLDGNKDVHNTFRYNHKGIGTFTEVIKSIKLLQKNNINFNILCVVNKKTVENIEEIYNFFKTSRFKYLQFIPCLDKLSGEKNEEFSLTESMYGEFLDNLFNLWYSDFKQNKYISIRYFDNLLSILLNNPPESCDMLGHCSVNTVIEGDGSVYPCDFYVLDKFKLGELKDNTLESLITSKKAMEFIKSSLFVDVKCRNCTYFFLCRSGCRRHKDFENKTYQNRFCMSFKSFFSKNMTKLVEVKEWIRKKNS
ncbi:anaerobic sulfatase maturase [uncultured Cetobacterium sp.]|uniref:anaerobic sulfatase maturase n=1 Tax=uncultured Cetobacterium sp. TaxID=527638 RepID=UPI00262EBEDD|nr:anaerobic sulfatase maturase [uncultured Cetobacterium sp.]